MSLQLLTSPEPSVVSSFYPIQQDSFLLAYSKPRCGQHGTFGTVNALDINHITFRYGKRQALDDVSLTITEGETVILLGPNGAGKTTLFSLITGLFAPDKGHIEIDGRRLSDGSDALAPLGIVFQAQTLDLDLSVEQNLLYFCDLHGLERREARPRIDRALDRMDLAARRKDKIRSLNGGHRRRVEIARATLHDPRILLLDEPTVGLDIPTRSELIAYLHDLPERHNCALLWATHLVDEIEATDRVLILHEGSIHRDGLAADLIAASDSDDLAGVMHEVMQDDTQDDTPEDTQDVKRDDAQTNKATSNDGSART